VEATGTIVIKEYIDGAVRQLALQRAFPLRPAFGRASQPAPKIAI
jgi:hypothetical protein